MLATHPYEKFNQQQALACWRPIARAIAPSLAGCNRSTGLAVVLFLVCIGVAAQDAPERIASSKVPEPTKLLEQLMPPGPRIDDSDDGKQERRVAALADLGLANDIESVGDTRLVYEDLDGDGVPEALFTVNDGMTNIRLVIMKRKDDQWYRLPSPPEFSCWCKYERFPLDSFVEVRGWRYSSEEPTQPLRLVLVRGTGPQSGTGVYERDLQIFALHGFELRRVFSGVEELDACTLRRDGKCRFQHSVVTLEQKDDLPRALVARIIRRQGQP